MALLLWQMEHATKAAEYADLMAIGIDVPEANPPEISQSGLWFVQAFNFLSVGRPAGWGVSAIPLNDMLIYWQGIGGICDFDEFSRIIRGADIHWMRWQRDRQAEKKDG